MTASDTISMTAGPSTGRMPVVLQVLPSLGGGGVERGTVEMTAALTEAGWTALVVSSGGPMVRDIERAGGKHIQLPVHSKNPFVMRKNIGRLAKVISEHGVNLVHARSRAPAWSALAAARRTGTPFVTTVHGPYGFGLPFKRLYNSVMTCGDRVIAISEFIRGYILDNYRKVDPDHIRIIHRGVNIDIFDPAKTTAARVIHLANEWRIPDGVPVVMLPGRLTRWKGHRVLFEALAQIKDRPMRCLIVGDDQGRSGYRRELDALIDKLGLQSVVHIVGECRDMAAAYKLSDVVISASTEPEAFGRIVAEAQAIGKPVIAPNHGAAPEILLPEVTGWLVPPSDPQALARALEKALDLDTGARERLAQAAIARVRENFSTAKMCDATIAVYRELLDGSR
ncbi:MAG: glycosyltransferase family 4 protein [Alphaproteobacteria bacterium]|nr:glycosyltransferase family 4 protein [Alphaproteobacteria bacterium]